MEDEKCVCNFCGQIIGKSQYSTHLLNHKGKGPPFCCILCKKKFGHAVLFRNHALQEHTLEIQCSECECMFKSSSELVDHKIIEHSEKRSSRLCCTICNLEFNCISCLNKHSALTDFESNEAFENKTTKSETFLNCLQLKRTLLNKTRNSLYECHDCQKKFAVKNDLINHVKLHLSTTRGNPKKICDPAVDETTLPESVNKNGRRSKKIKDNAKNKATCPESKVIKKGGRAKKIIDNAVDPESSEDCKNVNLIFYCCQVCERNFLTNEGLERHNLIHSVGKTKICRWCHTDFSDSTVYMQHWLSCNVALKSQRVLTFIKEETDEIKQEIV